MTTTAPSVNGRPSTFVLTADRSTTATADELLGRILPLLTKVKKTANGYQACCPAHDDDSPSLGVAIGRSGQVLLTCRAGCKFADIVRKLELTQAELFPDSPTTKKAKTTALGKMVKTYDYLENGKLLFQVCRYVPKDFRQRRPDGNGGWVWNLDGVRRVPYRLDELLTADRDGWVFVVEGEQDADALAAKGQVATCNPQGAGKWPQMPEIVRRTVFADRRLAIIADNDDAGRAHARQVAADVSPVAAEVKIIELPNLPPKGDVSDWLKAGGTAEQLLAMAEDAPSAIADADETDYTVSPEVDPPPNVFGFAWQPMPSAEFFAADFHPDWLAVGAVVRNQPMVIGAPQKTLKTTLAIEMGIALASATPWLGKFACPVRRRVAIMSGESGPFTLQETGRRICRARGISPPSLGDYLHWQFRLPQLAVLEQLEILRVGLERDGVEVVIVDPLYLSLLSGSEGAKAENLFDTGPLLLRVAQVCESVGATPILLHHTTKPTARKYEPLDLSDLAFSGIAEFARQWLLVSRREAYEPGSGQHELWMVVGGSVGHGGLWAIDVDEGQLDENFNGRKWDIVIRPGTEVRAEAKNEKADAKASERQSRDQADEVALIAALNQLSRDTGDAPYGRVRDLSGLSKDRMSGAFERLLAGDHVARCEVEIIVGNGAKRTAVGIKKVNEGATNAAMF